MKKNQTCVKLMGKKIHNRVKLKSTQGIIISDRDSNKSFIQKAREKLKANLKQAKSKPKIKMKNRRITYYNSTI